MIYNTAQGLESIDLLRRIEDPVYIYSHDNEQLKTRFEDAVARLLEGDQWSLP